jgi:NAD+ diphosphatase
VTTHERELPHVALSRQAHDRHGMLRTDEGWLEDRWADPATRVLVIAGSRLHLVDDRIEWVGSDAAPAGLRILLGERDGVTHFAVVVEPEEASGSREEWVSLRGALPALAADGLAEGPLVLHAIGLAEWLHATRHCPRCGGVLEARQAGHVLHCPDCGRDQFPRSDPAVIMLVTDGEPGSAKERALVGRNSAWPEGRYSTLAGFVEPGETMEDAVRREVEEETGVRVGEVAYFGSQPWPLPASLMIGFTGVALDTEIDVDGSEIEDARWFTRAEMRAEAEAGTLVLPGGVSISRSLIESWYGGPLPGSW